MKNTKFILFLSLSSLCALANTFLQGAFLFSGLSLVFFILGISQYDRGLKNKEPAANDVSRKDEKLGWIILAITVFVIAGLAAYYFS